MRTLWCAVVVVALSSCNEPQQVPDSGVDAGTPTRERYVVKSIRMPRTNFEARDTAVDLDGDNSVDNQLGQVSATFSQQGFQTQTDSDLALARGDEIALIQSTTIGTQTSVYVLTGKNPQPTPCADGGDTTCGRHFDGGSFEFETPTGTALMGSNDGGSASVSGTTAVQFPIAYFGAVVNVAVHKPHVQLNADGTGVMSGAMLTSEINSSLAPAAQARFTKLVARDCTGGAPPECGCTAGTDGATLLALYEVAPKNCVISLQEINENSLFLSLHAPDQTIDGQPALSLGFRFDVVPATFNGP